MLMEWEVLGRGFWGAEVWWEGFGGVEEPKGERTLQKPALTPPVQPPVLVLVEDGVLSGRVLGC